MGFFEVLLFDCGLRFFGGFEKVKTYPNKNTPTPRKIDMEPKNGGLEDDFPFQTCDFQVPC